MTWTPPSVVVKVALEKGPFDTVSGGDWTDLSDRVRGQVSCKRGRSDVRSQFGPGTITVTLDNSDRMLDPQNPSGLVYAAGMEGLPLCPVTVDWVWDGDTYRMFTGLLGPECWLTTTAPHGENATVVLQAMDQAAYSPGLPGDPWAAMLAAFRPEWWLRMDGGFPVVADGSVIPNRASLGNGAYMESPSGISRYIDTFNSVTPAPPALQLVTDNIVVSNAADIMPDGNETDVTVILWWQAVSAVPTGDTVRVAAMLDPTGTTLRWQVTVDDDGEATVSTYDSGGTLIDSAMIDRTGSVISRFDDTSAHLLIVRFTSGNNLDVWFGGCSPTGGTVTAAATVYESALTLGPSPMDTRYDEVMMVRHALTDDEVDGILLAGGGVAGVWHGDDWIDRLTHWHLAVGKAAGVTEIAEWHMPSTDPDDGLFGLSSNFGLQTSLGQAVQAVAAWAGGAAWVTKDGYWRARSLDALTDVTYAANYATTSAVFTDEDATLGTGEYRHAGVTPTGVDTDSIINQVSAEFAVRADPPTDISPSRFLITPRDEASIARFGIRTETVSSEWWNWATVATIADTLVERFAWPTAGPSEIHLDALADDDLTLWLAETCELELAVDVIYTPFGESPITAEGLNIQSIEWQIDNVSLTCDLTVARS
jgi:hypothetical protein